MAYSGRRDFDDDDLFDADEAKRRRDDRAAMIARGKERARQEAAREAAAKQRAAELTKRANDSFLIREYRAAGVEPPNVDANGVPRVGLQLLLKMGWRIEEIGPEKVLVAPAGGKHAPSDDMVPDLDGSEEFQQGDETVVSPATTSRPRCRIVGRTAAPTSPSTPAVPIV